MGDTGTQARADAERGAERLLFDMGRARAGERLLIVHEHERHGYFEADLRACVTAVARRAGLAVETVDAGFHPDAPRVSPDLAARIGAADLTVFLSRLGDQLRFGGLPSGRVVVCFVLSAAMLGSAFGTADPAVFCDLKRRVEARLATAQDIHITCARGSDVRGKVGQGGAQDTVCARFPVSIFAPVPGRGFSGRIAVPGFFSGTGAHYYPGYLVEFDGPLAAVFRDGRIAGFEGGARDVRRAEAHYGRVAERYGLDPWIVHSWHAGLHPGCGFPWEARRHMKRWSGAAFGNPRVLHFHTCGAEAPGEVCLNVIDATVRVDGVALWEAGRFHPERLAGGADLLAGAPEVAALFADPVREIGLGVHDNAAPALLRA